MGFRQADSEGRGGYARLWCADISENYSTARLSTSRKRTDDGGNTVYETDFQDGYVRFIGSAHTKIKEFDLPTTEEYMKNKDNSDWMKEHKGISIQITSCEVQISYDHKKKQSYTNFVVYAFNEPEGSGGDSGKKKSTAKTSKAKTKAKADPVPDEESEDDLPF